MKITKGMLYSTLLIGALVVSAGQVTHAATNYPDALNATTDGIINILEEDDKTIPNPEDPDTPVIPPNPNPVPGDLKLVAVTPFDFGQHRKSILEMNAFAKGVQVIDPATSATLDVVPYVATKDMRVDRGEGWHLTAEAAKFTDGSHTIDGAQISFVGANYVKGNTTNEANRPTVASNGNIDLIPETAVPIATSDTNKNQNQGIGLYTLALGTTLADDSEDVTNNGQVTDGVKFTLPSNTAVNTSKYSTTIIWTLAPGL